MFNFSTVKMSTSKSKPGNTKTQAKIAQTAYIQDIIGSSKKTDVQVTKESIDVVKSVYNWPEEDIVRVLQDCHNDAQVAINRIVDGMCNFINLLWFLVAFTC